MKLDHCKVIAPSSDLTRCLTTALVLALTSISAWAFDVGHSRVNSAPGQPLVADVVLNNLSAGDLQTLQVAVAAAPLWAQAGLVPPVALNTLQVQVVPGRVPSSRVLRVISAVPSERSVIDLVLEVKTGSASRLVQASVIVPTPPAIRPASGQSVTVMRGDTLIGIANRFPVPGADLYQMLWALFQANPKAFIAQNMNLLRAGAALSIPDPAAVRAVDSALARERYLAHVQAFRTLRGGAAATPVTEGRPSTASMQSAQGKVEAASGATDPRPAQDQVRLSTAPVDATADQRASASRAAAEEQARLEQLARNVEALKEVSAVSGASSPAQSAAATSAMAPGATESTGSTGSSGSSVSGTASSASVQGSALTSGPSTGATNPTAASADAGRLSASSEGQIDAISQAKQWVVNNVLASIAIVLALLALILAWALRSPAQREPNKDDSSAASTDSPQADAFKEKLQGIDLSLDSIPPQAGSAEAGGTQSDRPRA